VSVYLDHAATTPMLPEAIDAYAEALRLVGNPASIHTPGQQAKRMLEESRERIAASLGCDAIEVLLTSGGTESINLAIKGLFWARKEHGRRILVPEGEHHATMDTVEWLERSEGAIIEWIPLDGRGRIRLDALEAALAAHDDIALLTLLWANNEVGTIQPVERAAALAAEHGVPVHADAVAAYGQLPLRFHGSGLAAMSVSAHKIGGPVGIGALVLARDATLVPLLHGGGQQRRMRSGTQDAAAAVAFAVAADRAADPDVDDLLELRHRLVRGVSRVVPEATFRGDVIERLPGNAHFTFPGTQGDSMLFLLDMAGVAISTGSACQAGVSETSHVLLAMGLPEEEARGAVRVSLGATTTADDVHAFLDALPGAFAQAVKAGFSERPVR